MLCYLEFSVEVMTKLGKSSHVPTMTKSFRERNSFFQKCKNYNFSRKVSDNIRSHRCKRILPYLARLLQVTVFFNFIENIASVVYM